MQIRRPRGTLIREITLCCSPYPDIRTGIYKDGPPHWVSKTRRINLLGEETLGTFPTYISYKEENHEDLEEWRIIISYDTAGNVVSPTIRINHRIDGPASITYSINGDIRREEFWLLGKKVNYDEWIDKRESSAQEAYELYDIPPPSLFLIQEMMDQ